MSNTPESLHDDGYLWDRSGPVDVEVAGLERLLASQAWSEPQEQGMARGVRRTSAVPTRRLRRSRWRIAFAGAAAAAVMVFGLQGWYSHRLAWPAAQPWRVAAIEGEVRIDGRAARAVATLAPGAVLETGDATVRLKAARIGEVVIGAGSRFSVIETRGGRHRTQLQRGSLWARIWAPPGSFGVSTPAGDVFDLGCEFVLHAPGDGSGSLTVRSGWVQIDNAWREVLVPQGARVDFGPRGEPGTPYDLGASTAFLAALRQIDAQGRTAEPDGAAARALAAASRPQDAISLLSLLQAQPQLADGPVFDRMSEIMPAGALVTRAALRTGEAHALSPWWNALPYPRIKRWWMQWPDAFAAREDAAALLRDDHP